MFFPVVRKLVSPKFAPKITGMLIDLDVSSIEDILNLLKSDDLLREKVSSAETLLMSQEQQQNQNQNKPQNWLKIHKKKRKKGSRIKYKTP